MTTSTASLNNLVTVIALIGSVFSGYTGTTVWKFTESRDPGDWFHATTAQNSIKSQARVPVPRTLSAAGEFRRR